MIKTGEIDCKADIGAPGAYGRPNAGSMRVGHFAMLGSLLHDLKG